MPLGNMSHVLHNFLFSDAALATHRGESGESKKWMQTEDAGCWYTSHRCRMLYLISLVCLLSNTGMHEITGTIDSTLSPDQLYRALSEDVILVLLHIL